MARRKKREPTREDMIRAEHEVGENLPETLVGIEEEDVGKEIIHHHPHPGLDEENESRH